MTNLTADPLAAPRSCPAWCVGHGRDLPDDVTHRGKRVAVADVLVAVERFDADDEPASAPVVNIQSFDSYLTPTEARQLAAALSLLAAIAEGGEMTIIATASIAERHRLDRDATQDLAEAGTIHHVTRYGRVISCGAAGPVRVEEFAMKVTCEDCNAADRRHLIDNAHAEALDDDAERDAIAEDHAKALADHYYLLKDEHVAAGGILPSSVRYATDDDRFREHNRDGRRCTYVEAIAWLCAARKSDPTSTAVTAVRPDTEGWARSFVGRPAADADDRRVQEIVRDLLERIEAEPQSPGDCLSWCVLYSPSDDGLIHYSNDLACPATAGGPAEQHGYYVSVEQCEYPGRPATASVRVDGSNEPMTPHETLALAATLEYAARCALAATE